jgi:hypothetical protein
MRRNQGRQNTRKRKPQGQKRSGYTVYAPRAYADRILAQGTGATVRKPFGAQNSKCPSLRCWDAKSPIHLALPRAVADYTVIRLTKRIGSSNVFNCFGTFQSNQNSKSGYLDEWTNVCHVAGADATAPINQAGNYRVNGYNHESFGTSLSWTPSAFTVQIMNGNPIGTTAGMVYAAVLSTQLDLLGNTRTWTDIGQDFLEFMNPRILSAGKLSLKGVQGSSRPFNMSDISDFTSVSKHDDGDVTANQDAPRPCGWSPIVVYNPGGNLDLEFLVTTEYRVRFNIANPACASHSYHPLNDDYQWAKLMRQATAMGNGIIDIADIVASTGQAAARAYAKSGMT